MAEMGSVWQQVWMEVAQERVEKWGALWTVMAMRSQRRGRFKNSLRQYFKPLWDILDAYRNRKKWTGCLKLFLCILFLTMGHLVYYRLLVRIFGPENAPFDL